MRPGSPEAGRSRSCSRRVTWATNINLQVLLRGQWPTASVATRMSWAAGRKTTRPEDVAYCLLGIFDVNMPLLYGEGEKAFVRLQEEIMKDRDDQSIFAWDASDIDPSVAIIGALAPSPSYFKNSFDMHSHPSEGQPVTVTNKGIQVELSVMRHRQHGVDYDPKVHGEQYLATLHCTIGGDVTRVVGIILKQSRTNAARYSRVRCDTISVHSSGPLKRQGIFLVKRNEGFDPDSKVRTCWLEYKSSDGDVIRPLASFPGGNSWQRSEPTPSKSSMPGSWQWNQRTRSMTLTSDALGAAAVYFEIKGFGGPIALLLLLDPQGPLGRVELVEMPKAGVTTSTAELVENIESLRINPSATQRDLIYSDQGYSLSAEVRLSLTHGSWIFHVTLRRSIRQYSVTSRVDNGEW
ncbi:hypothetical protein B0I35DRAFT_184999 [Stachybotrys elegans]|uniref:DUF8212 domain-containing protein n=1 Tax=Stachybotrys elegans TaxID=80388 RepID=A0A8K0SVB7_9HYPO|nr:hypothetical protein B0I35DRAFT_184999 [Stachybotrys elegans]